MAKYIFLDNWVLSEYTKKGRQRLLSHFIQENNYTIVITSLLLVEMFNPGWQTATSEDRTIRATSFLSQHPCVIIDPPRVWAAEIEAYPNGIAELPMELSLDNISTQQREQTLLSFLRGEDIFVKQGKDIRQWVEGYNSVKASWLRDVVTIIDDACQKGTLACDANGNFSDLEKCKEDFLWSLDRRHITREQIQTLGMPVIKLFTEDGVKLTAVRLSSLCFWYAYVNQDKAYIMKRSGSDVGDFYHISLIPYCSAFTVDRTMYRLTKRVLSEVHYACEIFDPSNLEGKLLNPD